MYIPTPYFKNIPRIGDLEIDYIFLENDYPALFTCKNNEKLYLCICRTVIDEQKWIISEINFQTLEDLINNTISIYDAFKKNNDFVCIACWSKTDKVQKYNIIEMKNLPDTELPDKTVFLDDKEDSIVYLEQLKKIN